MLNQDKKERRMRLALIIVSGLVACAPGLFGSPIPCGVDSYANYLAQGQCALGDFTLNGFTFDSSGTGDVNLLSASQILIDPTGSTPNTLSLQFSADGGFHVGTGQTAEYIFHFNLDPFFPDIGGPGIDLGPNDPVLLTGEFCGDGTLSSAPNSQPVFCTGSATTGIFPTRLQIVGTGDIASQSYQFPSLVTTMDSRLILDLTGPANVDSFGWHTSVTGGGPSPVPEPSTLFSLMPVLLALAWSRKKLPAEGR